MRRILRMPRMDRWAEDSRMYTENRHPAIPAVDIAEAIRIIRLIMPDMAMAHLYSPWMVEQ